MTASRNEQRLLVDNSTPQECVLSLELEKGLCLYSASYCVWLRTLRHYYTYVSVFAIERNFAASK